MAAAEGFEFYETGREKLADGTYDTDTDTFKLALFLSTSDADTLTAGNDVFGDLTNEHAAANGYTAGGNTLASVTWVLSGETVTFDSADTVFTASGGSIIARFAVIYDTTATSGLLVKCILDSAPADVTATDGNTLTIQMNASGIFTLTGAGAGTG